MSSVKLLLNKDRILKDGSYPLVFQIIHHRRKKLIYTPFRIALNEFDGKAEKLIYTNDTTRLLKDVRSINRSVAKQRLNIESHIQDLERRREDYSVDDIIARYKIEHTPVSLLHYIDTQIDRKKELQKDGAIAALRSTRASLSAFIRTKEIAIGHVTGAFLRDYEQHLRRREISDNTICFYMRNLKSIYNQAIIDGHRITEENPFRRMCVKPRKTIKRAVDRETVHRIAILDLTHKPNLDIARDIFMFSFFARGMSFVDVLYQKKPKMDICYNRKKTNQWLNIAITPQLATIIHKYENRSEYVFPVLDPISPKPMYKQYRQALERTNRNLKQIAQMIGLETTLTTYVARHSWATGAKKLGASISAISESLGHTSEGTTQIYLKGFDQCILDQLNEQVSKFSL